MADILVLHTNKPAFSKGDIIEIRANNTGITETEKNDFVLFKIPNLLMSNLDQYRKIWKIELDYDVVIHQESTDGYRIRISGNLVDSLGNGQITLNKIENYIIGFNGTIYSHSVNEVVIDIGTYNIAISKSFLQRNDLNDVSFSEVYDQPSGLHTITADYSAKNWNPSSVERYLQNLNIISHSNKIIVYEIQGTGDTGNHSGNYSLQYLKNDITKKITDIIKRSRYYINNSLVDDAILNNNELVIDEATLISNINDKVNE